MTRIGNIPEIEAVKQQLRMLSERGAIVDWELPYESILTRLTAAIFFLTPTSQSWAEEIWNELGRNEMLQYRLNEEKSLSQLEWRVEFNKGLHG